jgi:hypothetical protein
VRAKLHVIVVAGGKVTWRIARCPEVGHASLMYIISRIERREAGIDERAMAFS